MDISIENGSLTIRNVKYEHLGAILQAIEDSVQTISSLVELGLIEQEVGQANVDFYNEIYEPLRQYMGSNSREKLEAQLPPCTCPACTNKEDTLQSFFDDLPLN